jgi:hypothetical protein
MGTETVTNAERRAPVQGSYWLKEGTTGREPGTIEWSEHEAVWKLYHKKWGGDQTAERMAERAGFSYLEIVDLTGHPPKTWKPTQ